jgi:hypothetical protein
MEKNFDKKQLVKFINKLEIVEPIKNKYKIGDFVYVIDWMEVYSKLCGGNGIFEWDIEIPLYSSVDFFWKFNYEDNLTQKGTINKREPRKLKEKIPVYKDFKYEILDYRIHPKAGEYMQAENVRNANPIDKYPECHSKYTYEPIYLLASIDNETYPHRCFVEVNEAALSLLNPDQYADKEFSALKHFNYKKWSIDKMEEVRKSFPEELRKVAYDKNDSVLFGSSVIKGKVMYHYIPAEFTVDNVPFVLYTSISYDGKGNIDLPKDSLIIDFSELPKMFKNNKFV